jgi:hypothetical protein
MRADLTGLAVDPVDAPAAELPDVPVWLTVVGGRVVHHGDAADNQRSTSRGVVSRVTG